MSGSRHLLQFPSTLGCLLAAISFDVWLQAEREKRVTPLLSGALDAETFRGWKDINHLCFDAPGRWATAT